MKVLLIDSGMANLGSARRALEECGGDVTITDDPADIDGAKRLVLPGVGAFGDGMANLDRRGWPGRLVEALRDPETRLLGICLGMQLLADRSTEGGVNRGLGLIQGEVAKFEPTLANERIPHVGWNEVEFEDGGPLFAGVPAGSDFYFVHSYHLVAANAADVLATTPYCGRFTSAVRVRNVFGVQFHPEKSGKLGLCLLRNFLDA